MKAFQKYLTENKITNVWGINCTTTGFQNVPPNAIYPLQQHPLNYIFKKEKGRVLNEYQMVYITRGKGEFINSDGQIIPIKVGTLILLVPQQWHSYRPDPTIGWDEYWVGFTGERMEEIVESGYLPKENTLFHIGVNSKLINCFEDVNQIVTAELSGYQQYISTLIQHMIGLINFLSNNMHIEDSLGIKKIEQARLLMGKNIGKNYSPTEVARDLGVGYTWFRRTFKNYVGVSPRQYQLHLLHIRSKELLADSQITIAEIAYTLGFINISQFSPFFRKYEGLSPSEYRKQIREKT